MSEFAHTPDMGEEFLPGQEVPENIRHLIEDSVRDGATDTQLYAAFGKKTVARVAQRHPDLFDVPGTGPDIYRNLTTTRGN